MKRANLNLFVTLSFITCILFTIVILFLSYKEIMVPDILIEYFFRTFGIEFGATAAIKISSKVLDRNYIANKIKMIKDEGFQIEKKDLTSDENEGDDTYYG